MEFWDLNCSKWRQCWNKRSTARMLYPTLNLTPGNSHIELFISEIGQPSVKKKSKLQVAYLASCKWQYHWPHVISSVIKGWLEDQICNQFNKLSFSFRQDKPLCCAVVGYGKTYLYYVWNYRKYANLTQNRGKIFSKANAQNLKLSANSSQFS